MITLRQYCRVYDAHKALRYKQNLQNIAAAYINICLNMIQNFAGTHSNRH